MYIKEFKMVTNGSHGGREVSEDTERRGHWKYLISVISGRSGLLTQRLARNRVSRWREMY